MRDFSKKIKALELKCQRRITAMVTGGSSGIGLCFSEMLAQSGCDLVIVSNREDELCDAAQKLVSSFGVSVTTRLQDLAEHDAAEQLVEFCRRQQLVVDILINNAGFFFFKELDAADVALTELMLRLHVVTPTKLSMLIGGEMRDRGFGYILNVSSMASRLPWPGITIYSATKAYLKSFTKSLHFEMRDAGVGVTALSPGAIATSLYGLNPKLLNFGVKIGLIGTPQWLVRRALKGMFRKRRCVAPGFMNIYLPLLVSAMPNFLVNIIWRKLKSSLLVLPGASASKR